MTSNERLIRAGKRIRDQIAFTILFQNTIQSSSYIISDTYFQDSYTTSNFLNEIKDTV
jgi:hypothetical protein